jgi:hypothetical protein
VEAISTQVRFSLYAGQFREHNRLQITLCIFKDEKIIISVIIRNFLLGNGLYVTVKLTFCPPYSVLFQAINLGGFFPQSIVDSMVNDDWLIKFLIIAHVHSRFSHLRQQGNVEICCDYFIFFFIWIGVMFLKMK